MQEVSLDPTAFRRTALAAILLPLALMVALAAVLFWQVGRLLDGSQRARHGGEVIAEAQKIERLLDGRETSLYGYLLVRHPGFTAPLQQEEGPVDRDLARLRRLVSGDTSLKARLARVESEIRDWETYAGKLQALHARGGDDQSITAARQGMRRMDGIRRQFADFVVAEEALEERRNRAAQEATGSTLGLLGTLSVLVGVLLALVGRRQLTVVSENYGSALVTAREQARAAGESEARFHTFMDNTPALAVIRDEQGRLVYGNSVYERFLGARQDDARGKTVFGYLPEGLAAPLLQADLTVLATNAALQIESMLPGSDGKLREWLLFKFPLPIEDNRRCVGTIAVDVSEQKLLEAQFRQAQKMEAVGRLAGGVAHDFNNMLAVILGYSEMLLSGPELDTTVREQLDEIRKAGERAAGLTRQLLAFSRQQVLAPQVLDLNQVVEGTEKMLRHLIGEDVELVSVLAPELGRVTADPGQIEQVIMNLAVNARDAMPEGGKLTLETDNVELGETYTRQHAGVASGLYVMLAVSDTGCGMDAELLSHVFEPFFTTKEAGRGTGLGLATVHGIVQQSGGHVWVYSEPGVGTTLKIYLPRTDLSVREAQTPQQAAPGGWETVLLAEDDALVRTMVREALTLRGYRVLAAAGLEEALRLSEAHPGPIPLLLTDVVMPGGSGRELAARLAGPRPETRALFMSGYTNDVAVRHGVLGGQMAFIQKPFTPESLARRVREVLDGPGPALLPADATTAGGNGRAFAPAPRG